RCVDVEEVSLRARRANVARDRLGERQRDLAVQMDADDPHPAPAERPRRRSTEPARRAEHDPPLARERPPTVIGHDRGTITDPAPATDGGRGRVFGATRAPPRGPRNEAAATQ